MHDSLLVNKIRDYCEIHEDSGGHLKCILNIIQVARESHLTDMRLARERMKKENKRMGVNAPYGWKVQQGTKKLIPSPREQANLAVILYLHKVEGVGFTAIAKKLNAWGLRTRKSSFFTYDSIRGYMNNYKEGQCTLNWKEDYNSICIKRNNELAARRVKQQKQVIQNIVDKYPEEF